MRRGPQLTFEADHSGKRLPAFRLAFEVISGALSADVGDQAGVALNQLRALLDQPVARWQVGHR